MRPSQPIKLFATASGERGILSVGSLGEMLLWRTRSLGNRTAAMEVVAAYRTPLPYSALHAALSSDSRMAMVVSATDIQFLKIKSSKLVPHEILIPSLPASLNILAIAFTISSDRNDYLTVVDVEGVIRVWHFPDSDTQCLELVYTSKSYIDQASKASITSLDNGSDIVRVAFIGSNGRLVTVHILLERSHVISSRRESDFDTAEINISHISSSSMHHVAIGKQASVCQRIVPYATHTVTHSDGKDTLVTYNTQSALFTKGLELQYEFRLVSRHFVVAETTDHQYNSEAETVQSIAFANTPNGIPLLLATLDQRITVFCQKRFNYYQENSPWIPVASSKINKYVLRLILAYLLIGCV